MGTSKVFLHCDYFAAFRPEGSTLSSILISRPTGVLGVLRGSVVK